MDGFMGTQFDIDETLAGITANSQAEPVMLHGFKLQHPLLDPSVCSDLLADRRVLYILNRIAFVYGDLLEWREFTHSDDNENNDLSNCRESACLYFNNRTDWNGGAEIRFSLWGNSKDPDVDFMATTAYDTTDEGQDYLYGLDLAKYNKAVIGDSMVEHIGVYLKNGVVGLEEYDTDSVLKKNRTYTWSIPRFVTSRFILLDGIEHNQYPEACKITDVLLFRKREYGRITLKSGAPSWIQDEYDCWLDYMEIKVREADNADKSTTMADKTLWVDNVVRQTADAMGFTAAKASKQLAKHGLLHGLLDNYGLLYTEELEEVVEFLTDRLTRPRYS